jgi:hypothetical protein
MAWPLSHWCREGKTLVARPLKKHFFYVCLPKLTLVKCTNKYFFILTFFGHILIILAWTKCRLVIKHVLSIKYFHSCFFLFFPFKFYLYKKIKLSIKDYLLLIYTFMCMIIFLRIIILNFQSHQIRILSVGLGMAWNRGGVSCYTLQ